MEENKKSVDIYIRPDLKGRGTSSFTAGDSLIAFGEEAGREVYSKLKSLADSLNALSEEKFVRNPQPSFDSIFINSIQLEGLLNRSEKFATAASATRRSRTSPGTSSIRASSSSRTR